MLSRYRDPTVDHERSKWGLVIERKTIPSNKMAEDGRPVRRSGTTGSSIPRLLGGKMKDRVI